MKAKTKVTKPLAPTRASIDIEAYDQAHVLLSEADAVVDVLAELVSNGDVGSLKKLSLSTCLFVIMGQIEAAEAILSKGIERGATA